MGTSASKATNQGVTTTFDLPGARLSESVDSENWWGLLNGATWDNQPGQRGILALQAPSAGEE